MLQYGVKQTAEVQSQMTAVERILEYTNLPKEGPMQSRDPPPPSWPHSGRVAMRNVFMRYKPDDPPVLKVRASFDICKNNKTLMNEIKNYILIHSNRTGDFTSTSRI